MITGIMIYLLIGAVIWVLLDARGIIGNGLRRRMAAGAVLAAVTLIVAWPRFVWHYTKANWSARR